MKHRTVSEIIADCGGPAALSDESRKAWVGKAGGKKISSKGVHKWKLVGIPSWHWPLVMKLSSATVEEIYAANARLAATIAADTRLQSVA